MSSKYFALLTLILLILCLVVLGGITVFVDPLFHYHAPLDNVGYVLNNQRYQNDGIMKNFDYDAIIIGSSMTQNFNSSEFDRLFQVSSIKVPFNGSYLFETTSRLENALPSHKVRYVIRSLDFYALTADKNYLTENFNFPNYLYDDNLFNDVRYIFNKEILINHTLNTLSYSKDGNLTPSFDDYCKYSAPTGKEVIISGRTRPAKSEISESLSKEEADKTILNLQQNVISLAQQYPDIEFYYFFPPQSILYWDHHNQMGDLDSRLSRMELAANTILGYDNIHLFSFIDCYDIVCNLDNYYDLEHHTPSVSDKLLAYMKNGEYELTEKNLKSRFDSARKFFSEYDYNNLYE